jgi:enterochelin esterase-like enzyme
MARHGSTIRGAGVGASAEATDAAAFAVHHDLIASWWTVAVLALLALGLTVGSLRRRRGTGPRPARRGRWVARVAALLVVVLAVAIGVNTYAGYAPDLAGLRLRLGLGSGRPVVAQPLAPVTAAPDARVATIADDPPQGAGAVGAVQVPVPAALDIPSSTVWVYTPPGFDPSGQTLYPTVYLLHGSPGSSVDWMAAGLPGVLDAMITAGRVRPMIVVAPDTNAVGTDDSSCLDSTRGGSQVETYLEQVLVPWVDTHFPVAADRRYRALGGMSAGAYCALDQGLRYPERYGTILSIMPYGDPGEGGEHQLSSQAEIDAHSPSRYVDSIDLVLPLGVLLAYDEAESASEVGTTARDLAGRLQARGADVLLRAEPGQHHTWTMALTALPSGIELFEQQMAASG